MKHSAIGTSSGNFQVTNIGNKNILEWRGFFLFGGGLKTEGKYIYIYIYA
jgi:hypothetical protein